MPRIPSELASQVKPIEWRGDSVRFLDQTLLPHEERHTDTSDWRDIADAVSRLAIRGAPLIGVAAAYALALAARRGDDLRSAGEQLAATRPTAVNLRWAVETVLAGGWDAPSVERAAARIHGDQIGADLRIGELGAALLPGPARVLTHCNTGALATGGIGTALGVIKTAHWRGKRVRVLVDETRPLLQGARLTAWELEQEGIPHQIIVDAAAAGLIASGAVDAVIVGADRIAANGDTANKVGTYGLALAAHAHGVRFYVAAPVSTIDRHARSGEDIIVEERAADEVLSFAGARAAPVAATALNPAFDVTPAPLITAIITEAGVLGPPLDASIRSMHDAATVAR